MLLIAEFVPNEARTGRWTLLLFALNMLLHTEHEDVFTMRQRIQFRLPSLARRRPGGGRNSQGTDTLESLLSQGGHP